MSTAALLATLHMKTADLNYYVQQQIFWAKKYEDVSAKLNNMSNLEEKWEEKFDEGMCPDKKIKFDRQTYGPDDDGNVKCMDEHTAKRYADSKVKGYDAAVLEELTELDIDYETQKNTYETLQKELQAEVDSLKEKVGQEAGQTYLIGGG